MWWPIPSGVAPTTHLLLHLLYMLIAYFRNSSNKWCSHDQNLKFDNWKAKQYKWLLKCCRCMHVIIFLYFISIITYYAWAYYGPKFARYAFWHFANFLPIMLIFMLSRYALCSQFIFIILHYCIKMVMIEITCKIQVQLQYKYFIKMYQNWCQCINL